MIWRRDETRRLVFAEPLDALAAALDYLKTGYQCRLGDEVVEHFRSQPYVANAGWFPTLTDWKLIHGVLGRAATVPGFFHSDAEPVARARVERLRVHIADTIDRIARHM